MSKDEILSLVKIYYESKHNNSSQKKDKINYAGRVYDENEMINLVKASLDFWLTSGEYTKEFEQKLANTVGSKWAFFVNSGSSANLLAFFALTSPLLKERAIKRGDEVITLAAGFPTTIAPIIQFGAVPVFVDVELRHLNLETKYLKKALSPKTKAVMIAHTLGNPFDINEIKKFCHQNGLWLIEDNCDALGSIYDGKLTGSFGDISTSSFYPPHHITTGEGGAVYTSNPTLKKIILSMRDWGRDCWCESGMDNTCKKRFNQKFGDLPFGYDHKYVYSHFGFNLKATDLQAAIGCAQIDKLDHFVSKRRQNYDFLFDRLKNQSELELIYPQPNSNPSWFGFFMLVSHKAKFNRNQIVSYLENNGIQTRMLFAGDMTKQPAFRHLKKNQDYRIVADDDGVELKNTQIVMNNGFWVGVYPGLSDANLNKIIKTILEFINEYK